MRFPKKKKIFKTLCAVVLLLWFILIVNNMEKINFNRALGRYSASTVKQNRLMLRIDWHDYAAMESDAKRVGLGEHGKPETITDETVAELLKKMSLDNGFNAYLSDLISVNRSVLDTRSIGCKNKVYLAKLPQISIVIIFFNEYFSTLKRSIHSIVNRTPASLLKEIILVDDCSDRAYLSKPLEDYVAEHFAALVQIVRQPKRSGLIAARLAGARSATAEVLVFFDSHIEANYNWLPPLLEPIAFDKRTVVCPLIDFIDYNTFEYRTQNEGKRGAFDWFFEYKRLPLLPENLVDRTAPFKSPVMEGGLFAINREFFWELGGYDEGLIIWGGEQYELSFKIWMCGGQMLNVRCSRVGHVYRGPRTNANTQGFGNFISKNYKRVAEVWLDEYKEYLYNRSRSTYDAIDAGDLSKQKALRKKLACKSFKWYMENVLYDLTKRYPLVDPPDFAYGAIQSVGAPSLCVDKMGRKPGGVVELFSCGSNLKNPGYNQNWALSYFRDLRVRQRTICLDSSKNTPNASVLVYGCHLEGGNQFWHYDLQNQWIVHRRDTKRCLEAIPAEKKLFINVCDANNLNMKWKFGVVNETALESYLVNIPKV